MDLIVAIRNHLEECSKDSSFTEDQREYFESAYECLDNALEDGAPECNVNLKEAWRKMTQAKESQAQGRQMSWEEFKTTIEKRDFFKGVALGGSQYIDRLRKAKAKYESKFNGETPDLDKPATDGQKQEAEGYKGQGNTALQAGDLKAALGHYSKAISLFNENAVFFANRSVCYNKLERFEDAVLDAKESIALDPEYVKGYNRLANAYKSMGDFEKAIEAFQQVVDRSDSGSKSARHCERMISDLQKKLNPVENAGAPGGMPGMGGLGGMDLGALGGLLGGMGNGPGGLNLGDMLKNPAMQQMAQQFMQDPNAMSKMQGMMSDPNFMANMSNFMGGNPDMSNLAQQMSQMDPGLMAKMTGIMTDPAKRDGFMTRVLADPEVQAMKADPEIGPTLDRLEAQDFSAFSDITSKPEVFGRMQGVLKRLMDDDQTDI